MTSPSNPRDAQPSPPVLYIPVEMAARELESKLLLAYFAVTLGFEVVLGQIWLMRRNLRHMPPGIQLFKTLTTRDAKVMRQAHALGYHIAAIDEEIPGVIATSDNMRWVSRDAVDEVDVIFAVDEVHRGALLGRIPEHSKKIVVAGNPRWDLLRPDFFGIYSDEVETIKREFGRFILINTNLRFTNSGKGSTEKVVRTLERGGKFDRRQAADAKFLERHLQLEGAGREELLALIRQLPSAFPGHTIVVQPHPGENEQTWVDKCHGRDRVVVARRGAAVPWIIGSDVLVHTYCTTGVEAFALGKPAVSYRPIDLPLFARYLSPQINLPAASIDEVVDQIRAVLSGERFEYSAVSQAIFARHFAAQSGLFSGQLVLQNLCGRFGIDLSSKSAEPVWQASRGFLRSIRMTAHKGERLLPNLSAAFILAKFREIAQQLGSDQPIHVSRCADRTFHIHGLSSGLREHWMEDSGPRFVRWLRWFGRGRAA